MASFDPMAASQIDIDPSLKTKSPKEVADRRQQLIEMFMRGGATRQQAEAEADRYLAEFPIATGQTIPQSPAPSPAAPMSPQQSMEADLYAQGYSADEARKQAQLQAEMQAEREREQLQMDLSQGGYGQRRVPSPRGLDGRSTQGAPFASVKEAEDYNERAAAPGMPGLYRPSQADNDMRARGFVPVYTPDGRVSYQLEAVDGSFVPGSPGRAGSRADLTAPRPDGKGGMIPGPYYRDSAEGPTGGQQVLRPTEATLAKRDAAYAKAKERQDARNPYKDLPSPAERMKRFHAQIQLGGGHLSPQAIQVETMLNGMDPEQRQRALQYMAPGGALAAQVDARNLEAAAGIARNAVMGAIGQQNNPAAQAAAEAAARQADPAAAGAGDIAAGKYDTPEAQKELERLATSYDTTWSGFSYENERALAAALQKPPYNMPPAEAEATAYKLAETRRWVSGGRHGGSSPPAPAAPPSSATPPPGPPPMPRSRPF